MADKRLSDGSVKLIRTASIVFGVLFLLAAVFAKTSGVSFSGGITRNQIGFALAGILLVAAGISGRKFPAIYKGTGLVVINTMAALFLLELLSITALKVICHGEMSVRQRKVEEGHLEESERMTVNGLYAPFVVWRSNPQMNSDSVTVDQKGYRITPDGPREGESNLVMLFGGSSVWGTGVSDRQTIAAHLQRLYNESGRAPVAVENHGQVAYVSTQEVIELMLQLRDGNVPDAVIFYDGFNDVWGAYEAGRAGTHHSEHVIAANIDGTDEGPPVQNAIECILQQTNTWLLVSMLRQRYAPEPEHYTLLETYRTMGVDPDSLARDVVEVYLGNMDLVHGLSLEYGFDYLFVIQPSLWYSGKNTTEYEEEILSGSHPFFLAGGDPAFSELHRKIYDLLCSASDTREDLVSYAGIFDGIDETVYIDYSGVHVPGWANESVAESLFARLQSLTQQNAPSDTQSPL